MKFIRTLICVCCVSINLVACAQSGLPPTKSENKDTKKSIYKYAGSTQCNKGEGLSLEEMKGQLIKAQINVITASCGSDGKMRTAMCGTTDGKIGIFEISADEFNKAVKAGFLPFDQLTNAVKIPCK